jgi:hypothetical protein
MTNTAENDRVLQQEMRASSPARRMARFAELQKGAFALLAASPEGYRWFWERNLRKRCIHASF